MTGGRHALGVAAAAVTLTGAVLVSCGLLPQEGPPAPPAVSTRDVPSAVSQAVRASSSPTGGSRSSASSAGPALGRSEPRHLDVPKLGVHVPLGRLGLNPDGTVQVPPVERPEQAGWYSRGVTPGERGAAVILGHVDGGGRRGVFYDLGRLRGGDTLSVGRADGSAATFVVESVEQVTKSDFPSRRVYGPLDHAGLRLVTCGGAFDRRTGHYTGNVIVYARLA
ncbi:class F sortase [Streptosporangium sp. NPDC087985]|uniref:class F sortase n=1 Tax=Streptosporangium sp. NPDC087985 TaxID=3366196 RepID=UPI0038109002